METTEKQSFLFYLRSALLQPKIETLLFAFSVFIFFAAAITGAAYYSYQNYGLVPDLELRALRQANRLKNSGWFADALTEYRASAAIQPGNRETLYSMVLAAEAMGDADAAIWALQELVRYYPDDAVANHNLGKLYIYVKQIRLAIRHIERAAPKLQGRQAIDAYTDLARAYELNSQPRKAAESRRKAAELRARR